jgi:IS5 family transposase
MILDCRRTSANWENQWYFRMQVPIGADAHICLAHSIVTTAANEPDVSQTHKLLHGDEKHLHGDGGYQGARASVRN